MLNNFNDSDVDEIIHSALLLEKSHIFRSQALMKLASKLRPNSSFAASRSHSYIRTITDSSWQQIRNGAQISDEHYVFFIHIPKCGGTSVNNSNLFTSPRGGHNTYHEFESLLKNKGFDKYKAFTITRNPWDRLASAFEYIHRSNNLRDKAVYIDYIQKFNGSFTLFLEDFLSQPKKYLHLRLMKPMYHFVNPRKVSIPLFVQKIENSQNLDSLSHFLNTKLDLPMLNTNANKIKTSKSYYNNKEFNELKKIYKIDIDLFNYQSFAKEDLAY